MIIKTLEVPIEDKSVDFNKIVADSDGMETPPGLFNAISKYFGEFNLDVACDLYPESKMRFYNNRVIADISVFMKPMDGLSLSWSIVKHSRFSDNFTTVKGRVWCNPPYSKPEPWLAKAYEETKVKRNAELAVLLLKFDCTTKMFAKYYDLADEIILLTGRRIRYIGRWLKPDGTLTINTSSRDSHFLFVFKG